MGGKDESSRFLGGVGGEKLSLVALVALVALPGRPSEGESCSMVQGFGKFSRLVTPDEKSCFQRETRWKGSIFDSFTRRLE